jgi:Flp pilus assembly protein TadD
MNAFLLALLLQSLSLPARTALENPASVSPVPKNLQKDYQKLWTRFLSAKEDAKLVKDLDKLRQKQRSFEHAWMIDAYIALDKGDHTAARQKFEQALLINPKNRIAMYYLAELANLHGEYARAATLYAQLAAIDSTHPEIETKRQRALLLATDSFVRAAVRAESENRLADAESSYRQALTLAPNEATLHDRLAALFDKQNRKIEADVERRASDGLVPRRVARNRPSSEGRRDDLEDLGRWGNDIETFHQIREAQAISREQFATLIVRYFPQLTEFRRSPQILTDIQNSSARSEIQMVVDTGLMDLLPNHEFQPQAPISRGELAAALGRLSRLLQVPDQRASISAPDVSSTNAMYPEIQLVLGNSIMALEDSGSFNVGGQVSGAQAARSADRLLRIFQQAPR